MRLIETPRPLPAQHDRQWHKVPLHQYRIRDGVGKLHIVPPSGSIGPGLPLYPHRVVWKHSVSDIAKLLQTGNGMRNIIPHMWPRPCVLRKVTDLWCLQLSRVQLCNGEVHMMQKVLVLIHWSKEKWEPNRTRWSGGMLIRVSHEIWNSQSSTDKKTKCSHTVPCGNLGWDCTNHRPEGATPLRHMNNARVLN